MLQFTALAQAKPGWTIDLARKEEGRSKDHAVFFSGSVTSSVTVANLHKAVRSVASMAIKARRTSRQSAKGRKYDNQS